MRRIVGEVPGRGEDRSGARLRRDAEHREKSRAHDAGPRRLGADHQYLAEVVAASDLPRRLRRFRSHDHGFFDDPAGDDAHRRYRDAAGVVDRQRPAAGKRFEFRAAVLRLHGLVAREERIAGRTDGGKDDFRRRLVDDFGGGRPAARRAHGREHSDDQPLSRHNRAILVDWRRDGQEKIRGEAGRANCAR